MDLLLSAIPDRALAVYAHPADAEIACGGTLARWADSGCKVALLVCARGDKGSHDLEAKPDTVAAARVAEVTEAASRLGLAHHEVLDNLDGDVSNTSELREALVQRIREWQPAVVFGHDPTAVFFGGGYINHRDHREVGFALLDSVSPGAASPLYFPATGEPHRVETLLLTGTLEANCYVDIGGYLDVKADSLRCHQTQVAGSENHVTELVEHRASEGADIVGIGSTEAFRRITPR